MMPTHKETILYTLSVVDGKRASRCSVIFVCLLTFLLLLDLIVQIWSEYMSSRDQGRRPISSCAGAEPVVL